MHDIAPKQIHDELWSIYKDVCCTTPWRAGKVILKRDKAARNGKKEWKTINCGWCKQHCNSEGKNLSNRRITVEQTVNELGLSDWTTLKNLHEHFHISVVFANVMEFACSLVDLWNIRWFTVKWWLSKCRTRIYNIETLPHFDLNVMWTLRLELLSLQEHDCFLLTIYCRWGISILDWEVK